MHSSNIFLMAARQFLCKRQSYLCNLKIKQETSSVNYFEANIIEYKIRFDF